MNEQRVDTIRQRLLDALEPEMLEIEDESHLHAGHAGARDGRGHFRLTIVSPAFADRTKIQRHQLVYAALGVLMRTEIHALSIQAFAPGEI